jgi:hypothetical protein
MKFNYVAKLILLSFFILIYVSNASATKFFYWGAEDHPCDGSELPNPPIWTQEVAHRGHVASGVTPEGERFMEWTTGQSWNNHYTTINNTQNLPVSCSLGTTYYLAYFFNFTRIDGKDIWYDGASVQSGDKGLEIKGNNGIRWMIARGQWENMAANQDHHYSVWMGNPDVGLSFLWQNQNGYSIDNPIQLEYERWYSAVMTVKMATDESGTVAVHINGVKILEYNNIITAGGDSPTIAYIRIGGTIAQPAYDSPPHYRRYDAIMLTDNWQDIVNGGYLSDSPDPQDPPGSPPYFSAN